MKTDKNASQPAESNTLLQLTSEFRDLEHVLLESGGEITPELEKWMEEVNTRLVTKVDACAFVLERLEDGKEFFASRAARYTAVARVHAEAHRRLKDRIKFCMQQIDAKELPGEENTFKLSGGRSKLVVEDKSKVPAEFWRETVVRDLDMDLIESALQNGIDVPGIKKEPVWTLRTTATKRA